MANSHYQTKLDDRSWTTSTGATVHRSAKCTYYGTWTDTTQFEDIIATYVITLEQCSWQFFTTISDTSEFKGNVYTELAQNGPDGHTVIDADKNTLEIMCDQTIATFVLPSGVASELLADILQLHKTVVQDD